MSAPVRPAKRSVFGWELYVRMQQEPTGLWEGGENMGLLILNIDV